MHPHSDYVEESEIDYDKIFSAGGANCGDEDFALFACPFCHRIYLLEYEVDTVYTDPKDLTKRIPVYNSFTCVDCANPMPEGGWAGPKVAQKFRVPYDDALKSDWAWILIPRASP
jgi:hypothetical protein